MLILDQFSRISCARYKVNEQIAVIQKEFEKDLRAASSVKDLEALKIKYLGKKGLVSEQLKALRTIPEAERPQFGKNVNDLKVAIEERLENTLTDALLKEESSKVSSETIDITLPGRRRPLGSKHPVTRALDEIVDIFVSMGFSVHTGPEIESEYYNFEILNFSEDHPARDMQDTFYIEPGVLLRTHTSPVQGRIMEKTKPPIRIISPGRVYRNESVSARSHVFFHQVEGLYINEGVSFQDLIVTLTEFLNKLFKREVEVRYRPSYFPFVEPGTEVDIACLACNSKGCNLCKYSGWLEICGAGMVHPQVLRNAGLDPEKYTGYAWGLGIERTMLLLYGINDIRLFAENDLRFLQQFPSV